MVRVRNPRPIFGRGTSPTTTTTKRAAGDLLRGATRSLVKRWPIERCPGWLGTLHHMRVPGNVERNAVESAMGAANARIVFRLLAPALTLPGDVAHCGTWQMLLSLGLFVRQRRPEKRVLGFDSLAGFDGTDLSLARRVREYGLTATVKLGWGDFEQSLRRHAHRRFCFVHLERGHAGSYQECLEFFYPRVTAGGILLLDEYRDAPLAGCTLAVDEFMADKAEKIERIVAHHDAKHFMRRC
jgi:hypothetical protein